MSFIGYSDVIEGLHERYATVAALRGKPLLAYEPQSIQETPTLYSLLASFERSQAGQITAMRYRVMSRLILQWQDQEQAELALLPFVNSIPAAVDQDQTLGGRVNSGLARIADAETGFVIISQIKYRCIDFYADVLTKSAWKSGI